MKVKNKKKKDTTNGHIRKMAGVLAAGAICVCAATVYTMAAGKHIWSQENALNAQIRNSLVTSTTYGVRGAIYDRTGTVIAQQEKAYTLAVQLDNRTEEEKAQDEATEQAVRAQAFANAEASGTTEQVQAEYDAYDESYVSPYMEDAQTFVDAVCSVLGDSVNADNMLAIIEEAQKNEFGQTELGAGTKRVSESVKAQLETLKIPGLYFVETTRRTYPVTPLASSLVGFAAYSEDSETLTGVMGLEQTMNTYLGAQDGIVQYQRASTGQKLPGSEVQLQEASNGDSVVLTLDASLQQVVEEQMQITMDSNNATAAWCLVMDPETGKILAWASYPTYDQNTHDDIPDYLDNISQEQIEFGSVFKPLIYSMAIDANVYPYDTYYRAGSFVYTVNEETDEITRITDNWDGVTSYSVIYDASQNDYGTLTFDQGLAYSSNIAICELLSNYISRDQYFYYLDAYKLFDKTGIEYVSETQGVNNTKTDYGSYLSTGFGQTSSLTVLELCQAYTAIFNDGKMMKPYVVDSIVDSSSGEVIQKFEPEVVGTPISSSTAETVRDLMVGVGAAGMTGERFAMDDVTLALKTGTGEIFVNATEDEEGHYSLTDYTSSVIAAAPADDPKVMVFWGMQGSNYLNYSADPFQTIMKAALNAQNVSTSTSAQDDQTGVWSTYTMPSLQNHTLEYAWKKLENDTLNIIALGDGGSIIGQYPTGGSTVSSNDTIFLLTSLENLTMPDMTGWTRKDVNAFSSLTGIPVTITGSGKVVSQSVEAGAEISSETQIEAVLE
jgi:penicillin-binding protein 2B